jgi:hypothetical protein
VKKIDYKRLGEESTRQHNVAIARAWNGNKFEEISEKDPSLSSKASAHF